MPVPMSGTIELLRTQVSSYDEFWEADHRQAMACRDLEVHLQIGLGLYRSIRQLTKDTEMDSQVLDLMISWLRPCESVNNRIESCERLGFHVDGSAEFRSCWEEARKYAQIVPVVWRGRKIYSQDEMKKSDFPYPPEPE